jgi:DNA polymerase-3 subunit delta'
MQFSSIPGLQQIKKLLTDAVKSNHSAHAQLFQGPEGSLNLPMAVAFAKYLHCENRGDDACGSCPACSKSSHLVHPDTHFVFPKSNLKNDKDEERFEAEILKSWRTFLTEQPFGNLEDWTASYGGEGKQPFISREESRNIIKKLSLKAFESKYKVMIIWLPERMHPSAANGILKLLEEPPPFTYFILVSNAADQLLPTILSRTQIVTIPYLQDEDVKTYLSDQGIPEPRLTKVTGLANGNLQKALVLAEGEEVDDTDQRFSTWMRTCYKRDYLSLVNMAEDYHRLDKLQQKSMMEHSLTMMRETLLSLADAETIQRSRGQEQKFAQDFSKIMSLEKVEKSYAVINDASYFLERTGSAKMICLDLSLQLSKTLFTS